MPLFVSIHSLQAAVKYYEHQDHNWLDQWLQLSYKLLCFIKGRLQNAIFVLYFGILAQVKGAAATGASTSKSSLYGSISSVSSANDICISIEACEETPLLAGSCNKASAIYGCKSSSPRTSTSSATQADSQYQKPPIFYGRHCCNCHVISFLLMLSTGLTLATYLLWRESRLPSIGYTLNLIQHDIWSNAQLPLGQLLTTGMVFNVFITHTASPECNNTENCMNELHNLQLDKGELQYSFLVAGDCQTYEGLGWRFTSGLKTRPQFSSLVLAFVGNFTQHIPSACQVDAAQALLWESVKRRRLQPDYVVYVLRGVLHKEIKDATALEHILSQWPHYGGVYEIQTPS